MATNSNQETANDKAWRQIFEDDSSILREIDTQGYFDISSSRINQYRETRLACKIDFKQQIPQPLANESLSVLAIKNGVYRIARTNAFIDFPSLESSSLPTPRAFQIPENIKVLSPKGLSSEAKLLDAALISGMLDYVFNDDVSLVLRGYERSKPFSFALEDGTKVKSTIPYEVDGVQLEVDGGYEGENGIYLVEAKSKLNDNINLRQLLYPLLHYESRFGAQKPILTYLLLYDITTGIYHFTRVRVDEDPLCGRRISLNPRDHVSCRLKTERERTRNYWEELIATPIDLNLTNKETTFPQANDFRKVLASFFRLSEETKISKEELFGEYSITERQWNYYGDVLLWLRVAVYDHTEGLYRLSSVGQAVQYQGSSKDTLFELARIVLSNDIFHEYLRGGESGVTLSSRERNMPGFADDTFKRRLSTVRSWLSFFRRNLGDKTE